MKVPTDPYVLDVHDFRRAGDSRRVERVVPAPAELGNPVITVPSDSQVDLDLLLESVVEGVLVDGAVRYRAVGECSRCLEPLAEQREAPVSQLYLWEPAEQGEDDDPLPVITREGLLGLEPEVRDAVVLDLPLAPVCREDCPGLCAECGIRLADNPQHGHEHTDPRWAGLAGVLDEPGDSPGSAEA
ncbi:MAG: hypothetical protein RLZ55_1363 [Actinomycetota bacterium]|jgi:uncharacterized protein